MAYWFEKKDVRRFCRTAMKTRIRIQPSSPIVHEQIFAYGANYFPEVLNKEIKRTLQQLLDSIAHIQDQKESLELVFKDCIQSVDQFKSLVEKASQGFNPLQTPDNKQAIIQLNKGFTHYKALKADSPKTYYYFELMQEKFSAFNHSLLEILTESTASKFSLKCSLGFKFKMDDALSKMNSPKMQKIPLARSLYLMSHYLNLHINAYIEMLKDQLPHAKPEKWPVLPTSISACGIGLSLPKAYPITRKLDIGINFPDTNETIFIKGTVIRSGPSQHKRKQLTGINFDFPNRETQKMIEQQQQIFQINRCQEIDLSLPEQ